MAQIQKVEKVIVINLCLVIVWPVTCKIYYINCVQVSNVKGMEKVGMWADRVLNHFWWCCWKCERRREVEGKIIIGS